MRTLLVVLAAALRVGAAADPDAIFAGLASDKTPGLAVLVLRNDHPVFERGYGVRDLRTFAKIDATTNFRLASFTKQFTAMAVMLLVKDGKLRYDERLTEVFPDFPEYGRAITIRHLLTHTAGLPDYEELMEGEGWSAERQIQDDEVLRLIERQTSGKFAPGTQWSYSNSGYVVLGSVIAKVSGKSYGDFLQQRIFGPLHMDGTLAYVKSRNTIPNRAYGHTKKDDQFTETDQSSSSATLGDGGVYSNLKDLAKWDAALAAHTLLSEAAMQPAVTPVKLNDGSQSYWPLAPNEDNLAPGKPVSYGFGWFLDPHQGHPRMWHSGGTMGFRTVIERFTEENMTVVILCNRTDLAPEKLALQVHDALTSP